MKRFEDRGGVGQKAGSRKTYLVYSIFSHIVTFFISLVYSSVSFLIPRGKIREKDKRVK